MAEFGAPVSANYTPPDGLATLGSLMSLKQKQQGLQAQQLSMQSQQLGIQGQTSENQSLAAKAQTDTRVNDQQAALSKIPWDSFEKDDGSYDVDTARKVALRVAPNIGAEFANRLNDTTKGAAETKQAFQNLATQQQQGIRSALGTWGADPKAPLSALLTQAEAAKANAPDATRKQLSQVVDHAVQAITGPNLITGQPKTAQEQKAAAVGFSRAGLSNAEVSGPNGLATPQTATLDTGGQVTPGTVAPALAGGAFQPGQGPIKKSLSPQVVTMPNKTLQTVGGAYGAPPGVGGGGPRTPHSPQAPRTAMQDAPPANAPGTIQAAYEEATKNANAHVEDVRKADNPLDYGNNMQIANQIRKLSKNTDTGPGTETWHHVLGALGAPIGANNVADYQLLGAYLDRQAAGIRGAMGLPQTNEGGAASREIAGNVGYQGKALQDKNDLTQALTEGLHQYRNGLDRIAGFSGQASPQAVNQFKAAWTQNFDPNVYKGELAYSRSKKDGDEFVKSLDPKEAASLSAKRKALQALSSGQLPK